MKVKFWLLDQNERTRLGEQTQHQHREHLADTDADCCQVDVAVGSHRTNAQTDSKSGEIFCPSAVREAETLKPEVERFPEGSRLVGTVGLWHQDQRVALLVKDRRRELSLLAKPSR